MLEDGVSPFVYFHIFSLHAYPSLGATGTPHTLGSYLAQHLPLLFPASASDPPFRDLAYPIVQGVVTPKDTEMAWLGACMAGADGWLNVCVGMLRDK